MGDILYDLTLTPEDRGDTVSSLLSDNPASDFIPAAFSTLDTTLRSDRHLAIDKYLRGMSRSDGSPKGSRRDLNINKDKQRSDSEFLAPIGLFGHALVGETETTPIAQREEIYDVNPRPRKESGPIGVDVFDSSKINAKFEVNLPLLSGAQTTRKRNTPPPPPRISTLPRSTVKLGGSISPVTGTSPLPHRGGEADVSLPVENVPYLSSFSADDSLLDGYEKSINGLSPITESGQPRIVRDSDDSCPPFLLPRFVCNSLVLG